MSDSMFSSSACYSLCTLATSYINEAEAGYSFICANFLMHHCFHIVFLKGRAADFFCTFMSPSSLSALSAFIAVICFFVSIRRSIVFRSSQWMNSIIVSYLLLHS